MELTESEYIVRVLSWGQDYTWGTYSTHERAMEQVRWLLERSKWAEAASVVQTFTRVPA